MAAIAERCDPTGRLMDDNDEMLGGKLISLHCSAPHRVNLAQLAFQDSTGMPRDNLGRAL